MQLKCKQCGTPVDVHDMPQPQIMNTPGASVVLLEHPKIATCVCCKANVAVMLVGANLQLEAVPVKPPSPIVLAKAMPSKLSGDH